MAVEHLLEISQGLDEKSPHWKDVAEALGEISHPATVELHLRLLRHADRGAKREAILSAGRAVRRELVPFLIPLLADREYSSEARQALKEFGPRILGTLADTLKDPLEPLEVRRSIPLVLNYIADQQTVDILLDSLFDYDGLLRYRSIRALCKLRLLDPYLRFDRDKLTLCIREECEKALNYRQALCALYPSGDSSDLLAQLLREKVTYGRERVFRLLALLLPPTTACASFLALVEDDRLKKASAAEYLDNVLPAKLKRYVIPLVEEKSHGLKPEADVWRTLELFLKSPDPILRECTADAIRKNRWPEFSGTDSALRGLEEGFSCG